MKLEGKSLKHDFFRFIIPSLIAQWVYALYTMIDGLFVARGVSELALSGVNIAMPFVTLLFSIALLFAVGSSTIIAIYLGEQQDTKAREVFTQNILTVMIVSILTTVIVLWKSRDIAIFLGATDLTIEYVQTYLNTIACFSIFFICSYSLEVLIKTDGYPMKATIIVTTGAVLNCILDYLFVMVFHKGVWGAAFATGLSQLCVVLLYLTHFCSSKTHMKLVRFTPSLSLLWRTIKIGLSSGITEFSAGIVIFLFNHAILAYLNEEAIVSYTIVTYVSTIIVMSMAGIAQGIQPLVSYHYGKKAPDNYHRLLKYALYFGTAFSVAAFIISRIIASPLVNLFISPELTQLRMDSVRVFYTFSYSFLICGFNIIIGGFFTAIEYPKSAMAVSLGRGFVFVAVSLQVLTRLFGGDGIWWAATLAEGMCLVLTLGLFVYYKHHSSNENIGAEIRK
ncbi:MATE family efflux transporter [Bariatricus sp. SGI.154]|uniref:MATE family efflux transporter n=1 Tax=Bariatricus sp. SGI.154 TaxID=3420549 RepID=UPI003D0825FB